MDYQVDRCTRHCATSGRMLAEGEEFFSLLRREGAELKRYDYAVENWSEPPADAVAWWKSRMPSRETKKGQLAPSDVLLQVFTELENVTEKRDMRYVLALLLVRRRVLRLEETQADPSGQELLTLYCPRDESTHQVAVVVPDDARADEIQNELVKLLFAQAA